MGVGVNRVLVHLLRPLGRAEIQVCGKKYWEEGSCTPIENEERGQQHVVRKLVALAGKA
jgi:hypothetical protein